jgi:hypothetical protein
MIATCTAHVRYWGGKADIANRADTAPSRQKLRLMMGSTQVEPPKIHELCDRYRRFVVRRSYSCLPGQLPAFLNRRVSPLVDVGGQIYQMDTTLSCLTSFNTNDG